MLLDPSTPSRHLQQCGVMGRPDGGNKGQTPVGYRHGTRVYTGELATVEVRRTPQYLLELLLESRDTPVPPVIFSSSSREAPLPPLVDFGVKRHPDTSTLFVRKIVGGLRTSLGCS